MNRLCSTTLSAIVLLAGSSLFFVNLVTPGYAACSDSPANGVDWSECRKRNLEISGSQLSKAILERTDFTSTDLRNSKMDEANFHKAILVRASFSGVTAKRANFTKVLGYRTNFGGANLAGADFSSAEISRSDFSNADLENTSFKKSDLGRVNFEGARLTGSNFELSNLARADLRTINYSGNLNFTNAYLMQTNIEGLDLTKAIGLSQWQVDLACGDDKTHLPDGLVKSTAWPCVREDEDKD